MIALDKTGTITRGEPALLDIIPLNGSRGDDVLRLAASVERSSEHPIARAVIEAATARGLSPGEVSDFIAYAGKGATGTIDVDDERLRVHVAPLVVFNRQ